MIRIKRVYVPPTDDDGFRILVDRLWPRGLKKNSAGIDIWAKEIAPSASLRKWFNHDPEKWLDFMQRYKDELNENNAFNELPEKICTKKKVTLLYAAHDEEHNNAVILKNLLEKKSHKAH